MLAAIFGGAIAGISTGLYMSLGGSVGGLDIIGTVIKKRLSIPIGTVFNIVNLYRNFYVCFQLEYAKRTDRFLSEKISFYNHK